MSLTNTFLSFGYVNELSTSTVVSLSLPFINEYQALDLTVSSYREIVDSSPSNTKQL